MERLFDGINGIYKIIKKTKGLSETHAIMKESKAAFTISRLLELMTKIPFVLIFVNSVNSV
jgi:hypothetical protein